LAALALAATLAAGTGQAPAPGPADRPGVPPLTPWACPEDHPIQGYVAEESGRLFYRPGTRFYEEASPERCYASETEARRDGARRAPDDEPLRR
jgi:hypothetical protein